MNLKVALACLILVSRMIGEAAAGAVPDVGTTYPIAEPDMLKEIEQRSAQVDWQKHFAKFRDPKFLDKYRPSGMTILPSATHDRERLLDLSFTLDRDIPDGSGGIIYPAGLTFNPLDYVQFPSTIVVINPTRTAEFMWFKKSVHYNDPTVMLLVTDGVPHKLSETFKRPVYYAIAPVQKRFKMQFTPMVIKQQGRLMEVNEYAVH